MKHTHSQPGALASHQGTFPASRKGGFLRSAASLLATASLLVGGGAKAAAVLTTYHSFSHADTTDAATPVKGLMQASDGNFYGVTSAGGLGTTSGSGTTGTGGYGVIFQVTPSGTYSVFYNFTGGSDGAAPMSTLVEGSDHALYGVTNSTSVTNVVYKIALSDGTFTILHTFSGSSAAEGRSPTGLTLGSDGRLYVTCATGGATNNGCVVSMAADGGTFALQASFTSGTSGTGIQPVDRLVQTSDGTFWGTTAAGGASSQGTVYSLVAGTSGPGTLTNVYSFGTGSNFRGPKAGLMIASDNNLYGTTYSGGASTTGAVYKVAPTSSSSATVSLVASMNNNSGGDSYGTLTEGLDHNLYGTASQGGLGSIFKVSPQTNLISSVVSFTNTITALGTYPQGNLLLGADHCLWGATTSGGNSALGSNAAGTLFKVDVGFNQTAIEVDAPGTTTALSSGVGYQFGSSAVGSAAVKTFTLKNAGYLPLIISGLHVSGLNAPDFVPDVTGMTTTLSAGQSTTFNISFDPVAVGGRSALLQILSNDPAHSTYSLTLQGSASASSQFSFSAAAYTAIQGARSVTLTINRSVSSPAQTVNIDTADGTSLDFPPFDIAAAGTDYTAVTGATVNFAIGQLTKTVVLTLLPRTGNVPNKRFTATISSPSANGTLGTTTTTTVQILATDTTKPTLAVTYPATATTSLDATTNGDLTITGTADDVHGISKVVVVTNGVSKTATLGTATGTTVPFSCDVDPVLGANTVAVYAYDLRGNYTGVSRSITMTGGVQLGVTRVIPASAGIKYDTVGTVSAIASPAKAIGAFGGGININPKVCLSIPTTTVRLTATSLLGYAFGGWSDLPDGAIAVGNVVSFAMPATPVTVTATFVTAPFTGPTGTSTAFYGLVTPADVNAASTINSIGYFTGSLSTVNGTFTGKLMMDGTSYPITATFMGDGSALFGTGLTATTTVILGGSRQLGLSYNAGASHDQISVITVKDTVLCEGIAQRSYYSTARKIPTNLVPATASYSPLTFAITSKAQTPTMDPSTYAQGSGVGTIALYNFGVATIAGTLADGTAFTASTGLTSTQYCPFFAQLLTPGSPSILGGMIVGGLSFDHSQADTDVSATDMIWIRPASSATLYTAGWPAGVNVDLKGALYSAATYAQAALGIGAVVTPGGNSHIEFDSERLTSNITKTQFNIKNNTVSFVTGTVPGFTLAFGLSGSFSGSFTPNWTPPAGKVNAVCAYKGILIQKNGAAKGGYGFFITNLASDNDPVSGNVFLSAQ